ncbi:MAG: hypothetical protein CMP12_18870 [Zunongwangia sp.]|uniref:Lipoprotein n=1 Tax=Zunongwangia profunda TaxID=398743 RepID=A0A3D5IVD2_9FLAO|nr:MULTISPECIES: hypothetical protein [Zunongwangia]MAO36761.1 hypothetical protein [Zunongwangia sp.]MAO37932.1 hypothetical protein [Zunongwangia sp.]MAS70764.1 hypothetical protein [Zunongwangia sp.]UAB83168.1 hypothetical protein INR75_13300 [Zunongwangia sp. SCSIO 43204]HCV79634.1 hypothetical protein [Zunongwangia profunda]|tara:strand:+ start:167 stop:982 length:816 start_codon:yes stop_codon:yes gene_type:complete
MNIKNLILSITILTSLYSCGQEKFEFESKIKPEKTYSLSMNMSSTNKVQYLTENPDLKDKTTESNNSTKMTRITTTKGITANGNFPATIEYGKIITTVNGNKTTNPISGTIIKGTYSENKLNVKEVLSDDLDKKTKDGIKYALENVKPDIDFPKKPLKIGDSFEHKMPMSIPIEGANPVKIDIIKTFTLKSVKENIAIFNLKETIQLSTQIEQTNVVANGDGNGIVEFDINESQIIKNNASFTIELNVKINDDITVNSIVNSNSEIETKIK